MTTTAAKKVRKRDTSNYVKVYPSHSIKILERLNEQRSSGTLCDITVHVGKDQFHAHRCMLAASCETFKQLINNDPQNDLNMQSSIKSNAFIVILDYIYTGSVTLEADCVQNVMYAAKYFNLPDIEKSCRKYMTQLHYFKKRNKSKNKSEVFDSEVSCRLNTVSINTTDLKPKKSFWNSSTQKICCENLITPNFNTSGKIQTNAVRVGVNEMDLIIEPKIEIEGESELVTHQELADFCAYVDADTCYDNCIKSREMSAISIQTLNESNSDDHLLESVLAQVNEAGFMTNHFNEPDCSNICVKRDTSHSPSENIKQTIKTSAKKNGVKRRKDRVGKRIKLPSAVEREKERVRNHIKIPPVYLDAVDDDSDTIMFGTEIDDNCDNLRIVMPLNGLTNLAETLQNSSDGRSNTCDNLLGNSLTGKRVVKGCEQPPKERGTVKKLKYKERELAKKLKYFQNDSPPLVCTICTRRFVRACDLTRHQHLHNLDTFKCRHCDEEFINILKFKQHSIGVHGVRKCFVCPHEGCKFRSQVIHSLKQHSLIHSDVKHYQCGTCGKSFAQENGLRIHLQSCLQEKSYLCDFCGLQFNLSQELITHRRVHTGERPYQCQICSAQFADNPNYKRHRRIHENAFPYSCHLCEKKFRHSNSLKAHMVNH